MTSKLFHLSLTSIVMRSLRRSGLFGKGGADTARTPANDPASGQVSPPRVLVVCDVENIWISARNRGVNVCFRRLHEHLVREYNATDLHAVCSIGSGGTLPLDALRASPWEVHTRDVTWVWRDGVRQKRANADTVFAALAGSLAARLRPAGLVLLTGDGDLACDTASVIAGSSEDAPAMVALGVPGSMARRLLDGSSPDLLGGGALDLGAIGRRVMARGRARARVPSRLAA